MRHTLAILAVGGLFAATGAQAQSIEFKDAVARVTVIPENRSDVRVEQVTRNPNAPITVRTEGRKVVVSGDFGRRKIRSCDGHGEGVVVRLQGGPPISWAQMPQIVVRTPRDVEVSAGGAVFGSIGRSGSVQLSNAGCGDWTVGNVQGPLRISQAGSGDTRAGSSGPARLRVAGSGDISTAAVRGPLSAELAGSGDIKVASIDGPLEAKVAGSGDIRVAGGRAPSVDVGIAGSGDVHFQGIADRVKARIAGSGDVRIQQVRGEISKSIIGSGGVFVGR